MLATGIWFMFLVWISVEHGDETATPLQQAFVLISFILCFAADMRDIMRP